VFSACPVVPTCAPCQHGLVRMAGGLEWQQRRQMTALSSSLIFIYVQLVDCSNCARLVTKPALALVTTVSTLTAKHNAR